VNLIQFTTENILQCLTCLRFPSQATVLEEMPPFPERDSSILAKLKKKKGPGSVSATELDDSKSEGGELNGGGERGPDAAGLASSNAVSSLEGLTPSYLCV